MHPQLTRPAGLTILALLSLSPPALADVIQVPVGELQSAIDGANPGDTLIVDSFPYETIVIPKELTLISKGQTLISNWLWTSYAPPTNSLKITASGRVVMVGFSIDHSMYGSGSLAAAAIEAPNLDQLVFIDGEIDVRIGNLDGSYFGVPAIIGPKHVYIADSTATGGASIAGSWVHPVLGAPAIEAPTLIARDTVLTAGTSGENVLGTVGPCTNDADETFTGGCSDFVDGVTGTPGQAAVIVDTLFGQGNTIASVPGIHYFCCASEETCSDPIYPCLNGGWSDLGTGPVGQEIIGSVAEMAESLSGSGRVSIGTTYALTSTLGPTGGILIASESLLTPTWVPPFGWIHLDPSTSVLIDALPGGSATTGLFVPPTPGLVGRTIAFQTLDNTTVEAGLPLMAVIEP